MWCSVVWVWYVRGCVVQCGVGVVCEGVCGGVGVVCEGCMVHVSV